LVRETRFAAVLGAAIVLLATPAVAQASTDLAISSKPSARIVKAGERVSFDVTVANRGPEASEGVFVNLFSLRGRGQGANNPYASVVPSQGVCKETSGEAFGYYYYSWVCELGPIAAGASAGIAAVVTVNESMNHLSALLPNAYEGGYSDRDNSNNEAVDRITASTPPVITGSKKIKLRGLPEGCAPGDFILRASTRVRGIKKMSASMDLGFDQEGSGQFWQKVVRGHRMVAKVPASRLSDELMTSYKLHVKAKKGGGRKLEAVVVLQRCGPA
jgi:hypothetical protein